MIEWVLIVVVAGLLGVERRGFLQAMLSRPLIAAPLLGLVAGHPVELVSLGVVLELFFLGSVDMGATHSDNDLVATLAAAACADAALDAGGVPPMAAVVASLLLCLPLARLGRRGDGLLDRFNEWVGLALAPTTPVRARLRANYYGLWIPFAIAAGAAIFGHFVGAHILGPALPHLPARVLENLSLLWGVLLLISAASAMRGLQPVRARPFLGAALAASLVVVAIYRWTGRG